MATLHSVMGTRKPSGMCSITVTPEQREVLERVALDIFADMVNSGATFQQTLAAIYLSGLYHAVELGRLQVTD